MEAAADAPLAWVDKQPHPKNIRKEFSSENERAQAVKMAKFALWIWKP